MKNLFIFLIVLSTGTTFSQVTTAMDWTKSDCRNNQSINLFEKLDSGYVIIQEYVMLGGCQPCITAGNGIKSIVNAFEVSNPGRVRIYQTGFTNSYTCQQMTTWGDGNNFTSSLLFSQGDSEVNYYGGMGMPTILVLGGGTQHKVYYAEQGYSPSHNAAITAAIDSALAESGTLAIKDNQEELSINIYPNPSSDAIQINLSEKASLFEIMDLGGRIIKTISTLSEATSQVIGISELNSGVYFLKVTLSNGQIVKEKFQKL